ncbi:DUF7504 family protein [Halorientalis regularis]|uniref:KaiC protein n=1 Tax=Halorientalis regularis TaxID=660518 RepID=A0A1G7NQS6_9EURY|nr:hypothetical protein [Halorientalis regularis]SDF76352.1 hypothetical protein SAMN05216218_109100 [Halorientalis regularis]
MTTTERVAGQNREQFPDDGAVLLLAPSVGDAERDACTELLAHHDAASSRVVHVLYMESAIERYRLIESQLPAHPAESAVVAVGAGGVVGERGPDPPAEHYHVQRLTDPADLTGLGMALSDALGEWAAVGDVTLCFDSLSILLQYADTERLFRFLHMLTNRLTELGASAHFHIDPAAHDEQTVAQLAQAFDDQVRVDGDGDRIVEG